MTIAIIGGGAAGLAAAIAAAEHGRRVIVLERNRKPLKKLGVTGNGRANILNAGEPVYYGDAAFALSVLASMGYAQLRGFFASLGVPLRTEDEGRVYPAALTASAVTDALLLRASQLGVELLTSARVTGVKRENEGFLLAAEQTEPDDPRRESAGKNAPQPLKTVASRVLQLRADRVIVTVGGSAAPVHGTDGSAYGLLTGFGHRLTPLKPALCALRTDPRRLAGLAGQRVRARLRLLSPQGQTLRATEGEVLFGDDAVSGIAAMQLARFWVEGASISLDLRPAANWEPAPSGPTEAAGSSPEPDAALEQRLRALADARRDCALGDLLTGAFVRPVARFLCREAGLPAADQPMTCLRDADLRRLARTIADLRLPVMGTRGFDQAQVTAGGVDTAGFDPVTLQSRLCPGLFAAGEVLNVDGECGGFNLMFAFASGLLAGAAAAANPLKPA